MVFNETTNYDFIYFKSMAAPSWYIQLNMYLKIAQGVLLGSGNCQQDLSASLRNKAANVWDLIQSDQ